MATQDDIDAANAQEMENLANDNRELRKENETLRETHVIQRQVIESQNAVIEKARDALKPDETLPDG